jgi:hypothetical protein
MTNVGGPAAAALSSQRYLWSVTPSLLAWPTLLLPVPEAAGIQALLFGILYVTDRGWGRKGMLPPWYMKLRLRLTVLAAGGLAVTATVGGGLM